MRFTKAMFLGALSIVYFASPAGAEEFWANPPGSEKKAAEDPWDAMYGEVDWMNRLKEVGIEVQEVKSPKVRPCIPQNSKVAYKEGDVYCEISPISKEDAQTLTRLIEGINRSSASNITSNGLARCLHSTKNDAAFDACVADNEKVISQRVSQNLKKSDHTGAQRSSAQPFY